MHVRFRTIDDLPRAHRGRLSCFDLMVDNDCLILALTLACLEICLRMLADRQVLFVGQVPFLP